MSTEETSTPQMETVETPQVPENPPAVDHPEAEPASDDFDMSDDDEDELSLFDGGIIKKIIKKGKGYGRPSKGSNVTVHYVGRLLDGSVFDSSRDRGQPFKFKIGQGQVIKGWDEGVARMKEGEIAELTIKSEYAYGASGSPPKIPSNATLKFEVELINWSSKINVTDDGSVSKEPVVEGEGWQNPSDGSKCQVKYTARVKDGAVFADRSQEPVTIVVGDDLTIPEGLDEALRGMRKGERCNVYINAAYGYGAKGNAELKVPANSELVYDVELVAFEKGKDTWEMKVGEKVEFGNKKKDQGNHFFNLGETKRAIKNYEKALNLFSYDKDITSDDRKAVDLLKLTCNSNIAACHLKDKHYGECIKSCDKALELDALHVKTLVRKGQALLHTGEPEAAMSVLNKALEQEPSRTDIPKLIAQCKKQVQQVLAKQRQLYTGMFSRVRLVEEDDQKEKAKKEEQQRKEMEDEAAAAAAAAAVAEAQ